MMRNTELPYDSKEKSAEIDKLVNRLDAIINIMLETAGSEGKGLKVAKRIEILSAAGLRPIEISRILGITLSHVTVELTRLRRRAGSTKR
jgi:hypothetical protein